MKEEMLDIVDENDRFVRKAARKEVEEKNLLHRVARVLVLNKEGELLVQKRSKNKISYPAHWDVSVAETVVSGEGYESAAMRGLWEELGISGVSNIQLMHSFLFKIHHASSEPSELCKVYRIVYHGKITIQEQEIEKARFMALDEIAELKAQEPFHPVGALAFDTYRKKCQNEQI